VAGFYPIEGERGNMLTVLAPAKVNLTLEVVAKRADGFHEIRSVVQTIDLCDRLHFQLSDRVEFRCSDPNWVSGESLVSKAADLLCQRAGRSKGAMVTLKKRIPLISGLSGDSSDAAATLRGLNWLWGMGLSQRELLRLAEELGSDVPFFLYGGTALLEGRGEVVKPLPPFSPMWLVLVLPPVPRMPSKTGRLYGCIKAEHYTEGEATRRLVSQLSKGGGVVLAMLFNVFDKVALDYFDGLSVYREQFLKSGAQEIHLAGSGPVLFTLTGDETRAERIYRDLKRRKLESYLTHTLAAIEYIG
jgi:4-diphosphocytidyl-2-C-methyl-D-erythritol kinase